MTAYEDTVEFGGTGAIAQSASQTLVKSLNIGGTGGFQATTAYPGWDYIQPVTVTNSSGGELTDFQALVELTAETFDYASANADGSDIRFTLADKLTVLSYWIEEWIVDGTSRIWVKVDSVAVGDGTIYLFYSNPSASSASNGDNTFLQFQGLTSTDFKLANIAGVGSSDFRMRIKYEKGAETNEYIGCSNSPSYGDDDSIYDGLNPTVIAACTTFNEGSYTQQYAAGSGATTNIYDFLKTSSNVNFYRDSALIKTITTTIPDEDMGMKLQGGAGCEWVWGFTAKYASPEPTCVLGVASTYPYAVTSELSLVAQEAGGAGAVALSELAYLNTVEVEGVGALSVTTQTDFMATAEFEGAGAINSPLAYIFVNIGTFLTENWSVSKTIQDTLWKLSGQIDKLDVPTYFKNLQVTATDHAEEEHCIFLGFIPGAGKTLAPAANKSTLEGFDYGWYLSQQYVPVALRQTDEDTNPDATITALLGGATWGNITGIEPYRISTVSAWGTTLLKKQFISDSKTSKWKLIQEICDYTHHVFIIKPRRVEVAEGIYQYYTSAYFVHEDDIDEVTGLDLPTMVTVTKPDAYLMGGLQIQDKQEDMINRVIVNGVNPITGIWYTYTKESTDVTSGDAQPIEYMYESKDLITQALTTAKAIELYDFFNSVAQTYTASFKKRMDLQLYQKIKFSGYIADGIPVDDMRIVSISYSRRAAEDIVTIQFTSDQKLSDLKRLMRSMGADFMNEQQRIKEDFFIDLTAIAVGTVTAIDGYEATVQLEKGAGLVKARILPE